MRLKLPKQEILEMSWTWKTRKTIWQEINQVICLVPSI